MRLVWAHALGLEGRLVWVPRRLDRLRKTPDSPSQYCAKRRLWRREGLLSLTSSSGSAAAPPPPPPPWYASISSNGDHGHACTHKQILSTLFFQVRSGASIEFVRRECACVSVAHSLGCTLAALEANGLHQLICLGLLVELRRRIALLQTPLTSIHLNWLTTNGVGDDDDEC